MTVTCCESCGICHQRNGSEQGAEGVEEVTGDWGKTGVSSVVPIIAYHYIDKVKKGVMGRMLVTGRRHNKCIQKCIKQS
jgi:hypothetical protein